MARGRGVASIILSDDLQGLFDTADLVAMGTINNSHTESIDVGDQFPFFYDFVVSDFEINNIYKGNAKKGDIVSVKQMDRMPMVQYFQDTNEYLLFLFAFDEGIPYEPVNPLQAAYSVSEGEITGSSQNSFNLEARDLDILSR